MSENFNRAIRDLDSRDPRALQDARHAILDEIRIHPEVSPQNIINAVNRVENQPGHAHEHVRLTQNGYLEISPPNYGQQGGYPPPGYEGGYQQPQPVPYEGQYQPQPYPYQQRPVLDPNSLIVGGVVGAVLGGALRRR